MGSSIITKMLLTVNGKQKEFERLDTVSDLLKEMGLEPRTVVVEVNERIIRRNHLSETSLSDRDTVEILRFVGGG